MYTTEMDLGMEERGRVVVGRSNVMKEKEGGENAALRNVE